MKHLGYLKTLHLHLLQDSDGDLVLSHENEYQPGKSIFISFHGDGTGSSLDEAVAEIKSLTANPLDRLLAETRKAIEEYRNDDVLELDLDALAAALDHFEAVQAEVEEE
jgi:hypothetical protein